ncbi:E-selectin-like [Branchiostoma floridae]|uniref:E-selectin-like n=1 Tax=Branchiostoma floridae TaxID=7739 RepID=A0A9J7HLW7_BRAFL|nr:E-selectin-like [Branchiostoma floridae]
MMRVRVLLTLVLIADLVWQFEAKPTLACSFPPVCKGCERTDCVPPFYKGKICRLTCRNSHRQESGNTSRTCDGHEWSGKALECKDLRCEYPEDYDTEGTSREGCMPPYHNGETCTYTCKEGFSRADGDYSITCEEGKWSGEPLECDAAVARLMSFIMMADENKDKITALGLQEE